MKIIFLVFIITSVLSGQFLNPKFLVKTHLESTEKTINNKNVVSYSVFSEKNNKLYAVSNETEYDIPYSELKAFDDGQSVLISAFYGTLEFYNNIGTKTKSLKIRNGISVDYERGIRSVVSDKSLIILFQEQNELYTTIQKYSSSGLLERDLHLDITNINGVAYSSNADQVYLSRVAWSNNGIPLNFISLINDKGQIVKEYNSSFEKGFFLGDNRFVAFSKKEIISIDSENYSVAFKKQAKSNYQFIDVNEENSHLVAVSAKAPTLKNGEWYYQNPLVQRFDLSGNLTEEKILETDSFVNYRIEPFSWSTKLNNE